MAVEQAEVDPAKVDQFMDRLIQDFAAAGSIPLTMIGISTGLWRAMAGAGPLTDATSAFIGADLPAWLAALDGLDERLRAGARVADVGCGYGAPTIVMAQTYPASRFWGFDYHDASIARARKAAAAAGVADRVQFEVASAKEFGGSYDLVVYVDSLHDLGDPAGALAHTRERLAPGGAVLLIEPNGADRIEDNFTPVGRLWYEASVLVCTANALSQEGRAIGTLAGEARLREVAAEAGFGQVRRLPVQAPLNLLLELRP